MADPQVTWRFNTKSQFNVRYCSMIWEFGGPCINGNLHMIVVTPVCPGVFEQQMTNWGCIQHSDNSLARWQIIKGIHGEWLKEKRY